jgi:hypothetical protein
MPPAERFDVDRAEGRLREALGDAEFDRAFVLGADTPVAELAAEALEARPESG